MSNLLWPGDERAGDSFTDEAFLAAMISVERAWLDALAGVGIAPPVVAGLDLAGGLNPGHLAVLTASSERPGNPAAALVELLRSTLADSSPDGARWLHRGLTSQDVIDTALMMCARDCTLLINTALREQTRLLVELVERHRRTRMVARTLTQHAVPTTFGLKAAGWLTGVLDAYDATRAVVFPVQVGGAAGSQAAMVELASRLGDPVGTASTLSQQLATVLDLTPSTPWHTSRSVVTRIANAAVGCTDAWGRIAADVLTLGRPEIGELSEGVGGPSSTMPHKANPVLATLLRRTALSSPQLLATVHVAAADSGDERPAGAWHSEWDALRTLLRRTVVGASQASDLIAGLNVHEERMAATLADASESVHAEQRAMRAMVGGDHGGEYLGASEALVEAPLSRAAEMLARNRDDGTAV